MRQVGWLVAWSLLAAPSLGEQIVMTPIAASVTSPAGRWRWLDVADQPYAAAFRESYRYELATVTVDYVARGERLAGRLQARGLKPSFAYQIKLHAEPGSGCAEALGRAGRWWQEEWDGQGWARGWNLNDKGDGTSPNPNDTMYQQRVAIAEPTSPTGRKYRFTPYLILGYFVTDARGRADVPFAADSSYHVLWRSDQRPREPRDGPAWEATFDADPVSDRAYDRDHPERTVSLFGEWERLPTGGLTLAPGDYEVTLFLTEESFHGSGGELAGGWAAALGAPLRFAIQAPR